MRKIDNLVNELKDSIQDHQESIDLLIELSVSQQENITELVRRINKLEAREPKIFDSSS